MPVTHLILYVTTNAVYMANIGQTAPWCRTVCRSSSNRSISSGVVPPSPLSSPSPFPSLFGTKFGRSIEVCYSPKGPWKGEKVPRTTRFGSVEGKGEVIQHPPLPKYYQRVIGSPLVRHHTASQHLQYVIGLAFLNHSSWNSQSHEEYKKNIPTYQSGANGHVSVGPLVSSVSLMWSVWLHSMTRANEDIHTLRLWQQSLDIASLNSKSVQLVTKLTEIWYNHRS